MRITCLLLIYFSMTISAMVMASSEDAPKYYLGQDHSVINWSKLKTNEFLDLSIWLENLSNRKKSKNWNKDHRDNLLHERAGLIINCVGTCHLYRGRNYSKVNHLSSFREGDELKTLPGSYLWVLMLDGTIVRFSPDTSVTMNEINISKKINFLYARINYGNVLWWSRSKSEFSYDKTKETDRLFLPLRFVAANKKDTETSKQAVIRLNKLIKENNKIINKPTYSFLVMPNGSISGTGIVAEFIVLPHTKSFVKVRDDSQLKLAKEMSDELPTFYFRGHENEKTKKLERSTWYEVSSDGQSISVNKDKNFALGEFITKNITTILTARELMLKTRTFAFEDYSHKYLGENFGYRLWTGFEEGEELAKRLHFIIDYSRRVETTSLKVAKRYIKKNKLNPTHEYSSKYYQKAMTAYSMFLTKESRVFQKNKLLLNSEKKEFWKYIHGKR